MSQIAVVGAGSWATALAIHLAQKDLKVIMWARRIEQVEELKQTRRNNRYLPGIELPAELGLTANLEEALADADTVVLGVPSHAVRETCQAIKSYLRPNTLVVNTAKGLEEGSLKRLTEVIIEELPGTRAAVLSGPSHAEEVAKNIPTTVVASGYQRSVAEEVQDLFMGPNFRVYTHPDVVGVELGGALKNVIALACGISDGLGFGDNTKAALMTRGLTEIARLGQLMGAQPLTFAGLSGVGDLIVTCTSMHSRNRRCGIEIGKGKSVEAAIASVNMVVEGIRTTKVAKELAEQIGVEMPITHQLYEVLYQGKPARETVQLLMQRQKVHEIEEVVEKYGVLWDK